MNLAEIKRAVDALLHELMDLQQNYIGHFSSGIAIYENNCILKSDFEALKAIARDLLGLFNQFSNLKREAMALSKKNVLDFLEQEFAKLPATDVNVRHYKEAIKEAMDARHEVDNEFVQLCIVAMRSCQAELTILRGVHDQVKDLDKI